MTAIGHVRRTRAGSAPQVLTGAAAVCLAALAALALAAQAGTVQVEVLDAAGQPLADAVVFLESADARKAVKPLAGAQMVASMAAAGINAINAQTSIAGNDSSSV